MYRFTGARLDGLGIVSNPDSEKSSGRNEAISAGVTAALSAITMWLGRKGPKQKVAATQIVDQLEQVLNQNLADFRAGVISRANALDVFDQAWQQVVTSCSDPAMGNPGKACVTDRTRGGRWDWFAYYRDPIVNSPLQSESAAPSILPLLGLGLLAVGVVASFSQGSQEKETLHVR